MQALFSPAVALMNRLRYPSKFLLLGLAVTIVVVMLLFTVVKNELQQINVAEHELAGVQMLKPMNRATQYLQLHRGLSAGLLGGNEGMKDKRAAKEKEASDALQATEASLPPTLINNAEWKKIRANWESLRSQGLTWSAADNIKAHNVLIDQLLQFMVVTADETELSLDPAMDTFYMMDTVVGKMPAMLERLGQTRARGTGVLAKKEISPQMKIDMSSTLSEMSNTLRTQNVNLQKVMHFAPSLQGALAGPSKQFSDLSLIHISEPTRPY